MRINHELLRHARKLAITLRSIIQADHFYGGIYGACSFAGVQALCADLAFYTHYAHQRVERDGGCFGLSAGVTVPSLSAWHLVVLLAGPKH